MLSEKFQPNIFFDKTRILKCELHKEKEIIKERKGNFNLLQFLKTWKIVV